MNSQKLNYPNMEYGFDFTKNNAKSTDNRTLVIIFHGLRGGYDSLSDVVKRLEDCDIADELDHVGIDKSRLDIWIPKLPYAGSQGFRCKLPIKDIVNNLITDLHIIISEGKYSSIRIVGHSFGGLIARSLFQEGIERDCAWAVKSADNDIRIVLLAGINRGMGVTQQMKLKTLILSYFGLVLGRLWQIIFNSHFTSLEAYRGSDFITKLRLKWLIHNHEKKLPDVVQLLGSQDDVVGPDDSLDLVTGRNFHYLDVDYTGHASILDVGDKESSDQKCEHRWRMICLALFSSTEAIKEEEVRPWDLEPRNENQNDQDDSNGDVLSKEQVVFVIHGIRDHGYWTDKIARRVWRKAGEEKQNHLHKVVDSYGFLGMGPFLLPHNRRKKVQWFMERYLEARAKYPEARFHFIGHSHGTYVLAKALEVYEDCKFDNIVFAGSIVRTGYEWNAKIDNGQVKRLLNFEATKDCVVAFFPRFFDFYNLQDMGGAGHIGFKDATSNGPIYSLKYAIGDHSAGRVEIL